MQNAATIVERTSSNLICLNICKSLLKLPFSKKLRIALDKHITNPWQLLSRTQVTRTKLFTLSKGAVK